MEGKKLFKMPEYLGGLYSQGLFMEAKRISGRHFVRTSDKWVPVTAMEVFDAAGMERPINGNQ